MSAVQIQDSVIFITGTGSERGIGYALVKKALELGAKKVYTAARDIKDAEARKKQIKNWAKIHNGKKIRGIKTKVIPVQLDVTSQDQINNAAKLAHDTQILINNAAYFQFSNILEDFNLFQTLEYKVNFEGPKKLINTFLPILKADGKGVVVNIISSRVFSEPLPKAPIYSLSKSALHTYTQALRANSHLVQVFGVYPGPTDTKMGDFSTADIKESTANVANIIFTEMEKGTSYSIITDKRTNPVPIEERVKESLGTNLSKTI